MVLRRRVVGIDSVLRGLVSGGVGEFGNGGVVLLLIDRIDGTTCLGCYSILNNTMKIHCYISCLSWET